MLLSLGVIAVLERLERRNTVLQHSNQSRHAVWSMLKSPGSRVPQEVHHYGYSFMFWITGVRWGTGIGRKEAEEGLASTEHPEVALVTHSMKNLDGSDAEMDVGIPAGWHSPEMWSETPYWSPSQYVSLGAAHSHHTPFYHPTCADPRQRGGTSVNTNAFLISP